MTFAPTTIELAEDGPTTWRMDAALTWTGPLRDRIAEVRVPAPFVTDLASVPRVFTWLFPRYGRYTKAAVVHDFLCQQFSRQRSDRAGGEVLVVDRSDADEVFLALMRELQVPKLRRRLMWAAVSWATLLSTAAIGRRRVPSSRLVGRVLLAVTVL